MTPYIHRSLEPVLQRACREFSGVVLTGPRQSGKTTLLRQTFGSTFGYVSLETPDVQAAATADPRGFLALHPPPVILDEIQHAAGLLPYVKEAIDARRGEKGLFLLTGSQNLMLLERVTESMAGRVAVLRLLPLSQREAFGRPLAALPWEPEATRPETGPAGRDLWQRFLQGGYPELEAEPGRDLRLWHASYLQTYLERDVRSLRQVGDLTLFQGFLVSLAARAGQLLEVSSLSREIGVAVNTARAWIAVLEATHQVHILRPYAGNIGKRLVRTPKVYFTDTGTLCRISGLSDPEHAALGPLGGAILETAVVAEIARTLAHRGEEPRLHFWRTSAGAEVDLLVESTGRLIPVEVKLSATPRPSMAEGIQRLKRDLGDRIGPGFVIHPGEIRLPLAPGVTALPFREL